MAFVERFHCTTIDFLQYVQWTAVFFAIRNGDEKLLDLLVENYADMNIRDEVS